MANSTVCQSKWKPIVESQVGNMDVGYEKDTSHMDSGELKRICSLKLASLNQSFLKVSVTD